MPIGRHIDRSNDKVFRKLHGLDVAYIAPMIWICGTGSGGIDCLQLCKEPDGVPAKFRGVRGIVTSKEERGRQLIFIPEEAEGSHCRAQ